MPALTPPAPGAHRDLSPRFYPALQGALAAVNAERDVTPVSVAERVLFGALDNLPKPLRSVSYALLAAVALIACILSTAKMAASPRDVALDFNPDHLASFSARATSDGRVYASLARQSAPARAIGRERVQ